MLNKFINFLVGLALVFFIGGFLIGCTPQESGAALGGLVAAVGDFFGGFTSNNDVTTTSVG